MKPESNVTMFDNTTNLPREANNSTNWESSLLDGPTNRRTLRGVVGTAYVNPLLTIAHQSTNENPGFATTRSIVRLEAGKLDSTSGKVAKVYAQLVISHPAEPFTDAEKLEIIHHLLGFLFNGANADALSDDLGTLGDLDSQLARLLEGEP